MRRLLVLLGLLAATLSAAAQQTANAPASAETLPSIMLLLSGETTPYGRAAEAVRSGFFAAHAAAGAPMAIELRETDETPDTGWFGEQQVEQSTHTRLPITQGYPDTGTQIGLQYRPFPFTGDVAARANNDSRQDRFFFQHGRLTTMRRPQDTQVNHEIPAPFLVSGKFTVMATPKRLFSATGVCCDESLE